jgi:hypothetical protein
MRNLITAFERLKAAYAEAEIKEAQATGSALKIDALHRVPSFVVDGIAEKGRMFSIKGGDGIWRNLTQMPGEVNGKNGVFDWLVDGDKLVYHRFIPGGAITGVPNQIPR